MLTEADKEFIKLAKSKLDENPNKDGSVSLGLILNIIDRQSKALAKAVEQRDGRLMELSEFYKSNPLLRQMTISVLTNEDNQELTKIMQGGGE